nr:MATE family efflux transporter [uncultured Blautia sp.]
METNYAKSAYRTFLFWGVCSSLGVTISTLVDATLVGNFIGSTGLAVANIATPVFLLYLLMGITLGGGAGVLIGKKLGEADLKGANRFFGSVLSAGLITGVLFAAVSLVFRSALCSLLGATPELLPQALQYLTVVFAFAPIYVVYNILSIAVRTDGAPKLAAISSAGVIVTNLSLDLLFMKVLNWGLVGASASLCIAETVGTLVLLTHFWNKQALLSFHFHIPTWNEIKEYVENGFGVGSAFIFQAVVMLVFNTMLLKGNSENGTFSVAVFGVIYTMSTIPGAMFDGAGAAASTVISILGGEKDWKGMLSVYHDGLRIVAVAGMIIALFFAAGAKNILIFFGLNDGQTLETAAVAFRIYALSVALAGMNVVTTSFWQTIEKTRYASGLSVLRNFVLMLAAGFILIDKKGIVGLALVYVISEGVCLLLVLAIQIFGKIKDYIKEKYSFTNRVFEEYYPIEEGSMEKMSQNLEGLCDEWELDFKQSFFIHLIVEELLLNIMKFGIGETDKKYYVSVKVMDNNGECILRIRDNVNSYNPFDLRGDEVDRAVMEMIKKKAKYYEYQRKLVFNYLYVTI